VNYIFQLDIALLYSLVIFIILLVVIKTTKIFLENSAFRERLRKSDTEPDTKPCPSCGKDIPSQSKYCLHCGVGPIN